MVQGVALQPFLLFFLLPTTMSHSNKRPRTTSSSLSRSHSPGPSEASTFNANDSQVSTSQNGTPSFVAAVRRERAKEKYVGKSPEDVLSKPNHSKTLSSTNLAQNYRRKPGALQSTTTLTHQQSLK